MLNRPQKDALRSKSSKRSRKRWHDDRYNVPSMGCSVCPEFKICGGLKISKPLFWCLDNCCGNPSKCDVACRNNLKFVDHVREVGGFDLSSVGRAPAVELPPLPKVSSLLFHGNSRVASLNTSDVTLPFARMFDRRTGQARFGSREELCVAFRIDQTNNIILSGTDTDPPIEGWWQIGRERRLSLIKQLRLQNVALVTTPNYSLFVDQPRWDDLYSMKRIALIHSEMLNEGLQAALHVNGRTDTDFLRWTEYIQARSEIQIIAYEFATGTGFAGRRELHAEWLIELARNVGRPLHLVIRGGVDLIPEFSRRFSGISIIDTSAFMKTMKRQRATFAEGGKLTWRTAPTKIGAPLDGLLQENVASVRAWIHNQFPVPVAKPLVRELRVV